jgi:hypothetical protein
MRYSTETSDPSIPDTIPQPRGLALKVFSVYSDAFLSAGRGIPTQDFLFNSTPALELSDAKTTAEILALRVKHAGDQEALDRELSKRKDAELQKARDHVPNVPLQSMRMYSQAAFRFGEYVAKFSLVPTGSTQRAMAAQKVGAGESETVLADWLSAFYGAHEAEYDFQVQLLENLEEQSVEDLGTPWDEVKYPFQTVGRIVVPVQESFDNARKVFWEDRVRMDPWLGLQSLKPLGSANRLRRQGEF